MNRRAARRCRHRDRGVSADEQGDGEDCPVCESRATGKTRESTPAVVSLRPKHRRLWVAAQDSRHGTNDWKGNHRDNAKGQVRQEGMRSVVPELFCTDCRRGTESNHVEHDGQ
eukprot:3403594-Pleurochrysis_carterae.AAC.1